MKILVSGSKGFIGSSLVAALQADGHQVMSLTRKVGGPREEEIHWNPSLMQMEIPRLEGFDAIIHLAGESIAEGKWTKEKKRKILDSRVEGTKFLSGAITHLKHPPHVLVVASAIGIYGDRGEEILSEASPLGSGFLADVCRAWEEAAQPAKNIGVRVVHLRFGIVLGRKGGALAKMLPPFKWGVGGRLGDGKQYMSWISLEDVIGVIRFSISNEKLQGPVNTVGPQPVTNREFTKTLGAALHRPTILPAPAFGLKLLLGEMAQELLLSSARVKPQKLLEAGYPFRHTNLETTLNSIL